jgi:hypothetical protein
MEDAKGMEDGLTAPKPHVVELPAQILMLTALVAIGALLLVVTVLRH